MSTVTDLYSRLSQVEEQFLDAYSHYTSTDSTTELDKFSSSWAELVQDFERTPNVDDRTKELAYVVSSRIARLSEAFEDLDRTTEELTEKYFSDSPFLSPHTKTRPLATSNYIDSARSWLLQNLHNPYPPQTLRDSLSRRFQVSTKAINAWFTDARNRIGWTSLRKDCFQNKRTKIVEAAQQYYLQSKFNGDYAIAVRFARIERTANHLFGAKFLESQLAGSLDERSEHDSTPNAQSSPSFNPYPSPDTSGVSTPEPLSSPELSQNDHYLTPVEGPTGPLTCDNDGGTRRDNVEQPSTTSLSFPARSLGEAEAPKTTDTGINTRKRKRCLSKDSDERELKRPYPDVASDTPDSSLVIDDWFQQHFDFASHFQDPLAFSGPVEVELFDYSSINTLPLTCTYLMLARGKPEFTPGFFLATGAFDSSTTTLTPVSTIWPLENSRERNCLSVVTFAVTLFRFCTRSTT
uniref:HD1 mating type protein n=1 Tax=Volvariella volvacea TaxID=36659 RepID=A0A0D3MKY6_9AGAR|nr:HD1 mating type protein [Volvariella volvacea]